MVLLANAVTVQVILVSCVGKHFCNDHDVMQNGTLSHVM